MNRISQFDQRFKTKWATRYPRYAKMMNTNQQPSNADTIGFNVWKIIPHTQRSDRVLDVQAKTHLEALIKFLEQDKGSGHYKIFPVELDPNIKRYSETKTVTHFVGDENGTVIHYRAIQVLMPPHLTQTHFSYELQS